MSKFAPLYIVTSIRLEKCLLSMNTHLRTIGLDYYKLLKMQQEIILYTTLRKGVGHIKVITSNSKTAT